MARQSWIIILSPSAILLTDAGRLTGSRRKHLFQLFATLTNSVTSDHHFHQSSCHHLPPFLNPHAHIPSFFLQKPHQSGWINVSQIKSTYIRLFIHKIKKWNMQTMIRMKSYHSTLRSWVGGLKRNNDDDESESEAKVLCKGLLCINSGKGHKREIGRRCNRARVQLTWLIL